ARKRKHVSNFVCTKRSRVVHESAFGEKRETGYEHAEGEGESEKLPEHRSEVRVFERVDIGSPPRTALVGRSRKRRHAGQNEIRRHNACERKSGRGQNRVVIAILGQIAGHRRPNQKTQTK